MFENNYDTYNEDDVWDVFGEEEEEEKKYTDDMCDKPDLFHSNPREYSFFYTLIVKNEIDTDDGNLNTMKRIIKFIVEKFKERGICADVIIIDEKRKYSTKHNRKTEEDMTTIKALIDKGLNNSDIEHITGITRKTVAKYRKKFK